MTEQELPIPAHYDPEKVGHVWRVPYQQRTEEAYAWAKQHDIRPAAEDRLKIGVIAIDVQNTFCIPEFELFVSGRSGIGAVEDNRRFCEFLYCNLGVITQITATMDTHQAMQIFHPVFLVNAAGEHPAPYTLISHEDIQEGRWRFNPSIAQSLQLDADFGQRLLAHYTWTLKMRNKYDLTIWPYHAMLGGIGHALVSAVEEAVFFHTQARNSQADFEIKGKNPLTEHYSAIGPEVLTGPSGEQIAQKNAKFIQKLRDFDLVVVAGQAKSHCLAWTIDDLLEEIRLVDKHLVEKVYLLEDCTSPVVVPGVVDYTDDANAAFERYKQAGMHIVRSTEPVASWPGVEKQRSI
jgi:nicotinamidase-related amidase